MIKVKINKQTIYRIFVFSVCILILFCMDYFKIGESGFKAYSRGVRLPDMQFGYSPGQVLNIVDSLGTEGRLFYLRFLIFDFIFIVSFAFSQTEVLKIIMGKVLLKSKWSYLLILPLLRGFFDTVENLLIIVILANYPVQLAGIARLAGIATALKFVALWLWVVAAVILFGVRKTGFKDKIKNLG